MKLKRFVYIKELAACLMVSFILNSCSVNKSEIATNKYADSIDKFVNECYSKGLFSGNVLVADKGKIIYENSFGYSNCETEELNKIDTKFRIGSMTKQFTSMMIMQLIEEGAIRLDGKITDYLKEYRGDTGDKITIHHLLTHQSGIIDFCYYEKFWSQYSKNTFSNEFLLREFYSNDLEFEPGTKVNYCNTGYSILALIIEKVTGKSYEENLKIRITQPLQMKNTGVIKTDSPLENMAIGYINRFLEWEPSFIEMNNFMGCGNIYSTLYDLYKWNQALSSNQLLSEEYMQIMFKPNLENYAYGWIVEDVVINEDTLENIYHQGHIDGFCSIISRIEDTTTTIILLHNGGVTKVYEMSKEILSILNKKDYKIPKIPIDIRLSREIHKAGEPNLLETYIQLKKDSLTYYDFDTYYLYALVSNLKAIDKSKIANKINEIIDYELR